MQICVDDPSTTECETLAPPSEATVQEVAAYSDETELAFELIQEHLRGGVIVDDTAMKMAFKDFLKLHRATYKRRNEAGTPHLISTLERELHGSPLIGGVYPQRKRAKTRDEPERRRDRLGPGREIFGKYDPDVNPFE